MTNYRVLEAGLTWLNTNDVLTQAQLGEFLKELDTTLETSEADTGAKFEPTEDEPYSYFEAQADKYFPTFYATPEEERPLGLEETAIWLEKQGAHVNDSALIASRIRERLTADFQAKLKAQR